MQSHKGQNKKYVVILLLSVLLMALVMAGLWLLQQEEEPEAFSSSIDETDEANSDTAGVVYFDGVAYIPKEHLTTTLILGIDETGLMESNGSYINSAQSDFVTLIVLDEDTDSYSLLQLNRDTMLDVQCYGVGGKYVGTSVMQLALAHTYGDGMEDSCENSVTAVSTFLYGAEIDHYIAVNMTGVERLVDGIGGVTVTIQDDFSSVDPSLVEGETMTLTGSQCVTYIRSRKDVGEETNLSRMERQKQFMLEVMEQLQVKWSEDSGSITGVLTDIASYMLSDYSGTKLINFMDQLAQCECEGIVSPDGEAVLGEEYMEFYADEDSVKQCVIALFYQPAETGAED
ncbi:MAG: LCP family protein [Clostridiales bacterium]|nr:LCP family protein [Clostridiales bacterium]